MSSLNMLMQGMQMTLLFAGWPGLSGQVKGESLCCSLQGMAEEKLYPCQEKIVAHVRK